jgi:IQ motif/SEC7 domain-containing protein
MMQEIYGQIHPKSAASSNFVRTYSTPPKAKKTVRIQTPDDYGQQSQGSDAEVTNDNDELTRRRQYRVGLNLFNQNPEQGMAYLWSKKFLDYSPAAVAKFLKDRKGLSKTKIGEYLCSLHRPFNLAALHCFVHELDFTGLHLDIALRQLQQEVTFPKEAQKIEKFVEVFSKRYIQCNQMFVSGFKSPDTIFVLSYAIVLLNTDLHSQALRPNKRMKRDDFVRNLTGIDAGDNIDEDMLKGIYDRIRSAEFRAGADHVSQVAKVEEAIVGRKRDQGSLAEPFRRLVCFCRLAEVPDMNKKVKKDGAHQRGVFLFNDLLIVCKTVASKRKTVHQFRFSVPVRGLFINVFSTAQFNYGVQLQDRSGKIVATFNAKSESDQQRFVTDLQEAVAEMAEMDRARFEALVESETMC